MTFINLCLNVNNSFYFILLGVILMLSKLKKTHMDFILCDHTHLSPKQNSNNTCKSTNKNVQIWITFLYYSSPNEFWNWNIIIVFFLGPQSVAELKRILNEALRKFKEQRNEL